MCAANARCVTANTSIAARSSSGVIRLIYPDMVPMANFLSIQSDSRLHYHFLWNMFCLG